MKNPSHPGEMVWRQCIVPRGLTIATAAEALGVTRQALNNVVSGKSGISPEMAVRLSKAFGNSPEAWLRMQMNYDLCRLKTTIQVKRVKAAPRGRPSKREGFDGKMCVELRRNHKPVAL